MKPIDEKDRPFGYSGYTGADAKELSRLAAKPRDVKVTEENFLQICDRLAEGEPLVLICADQTMPSRRDLMRFLYKDEKALEMYYHAREMQMEAFAEEALSVANDDSQDYSIDDKGRRISHNDVVQRARLKIETMWRTMSRMAPRRFGEKNFTEIQGNPNQPVVLSVVTGVPRHAGSLVRGESNPPKVIEGTVQRAPDDSAGS